jgi:hypothetical protein
LTRACRSRFVGNLPVTWSARRSSAGGPNLANGKLFDTAEADGYEVLVATDQNIKHQQNLAARLESAKLGVLGEVPI